MNSILKPIVAFLMFLVVLFFIATILTIATDLPSRASVTLALVSAVLVGWYSWKLVAGEKVGVGVSVVCGALMLGGIGFIIGFLGPMIVAKDTSQGPLVGVFIAVPLGVIMGSIGGYFLASKKRVRADSKI